MRNHISEKSEKPTPFMGGYVTFLLMHHLLSLSISLTIITTTYLLLEEVSNMWCDSTELECGEVKIKDAVEKLKKERNFCSLNKRRSIDRLIPEAHATLGRFHKCRYSFEELFARDYTYQAITPVEHLF